MNPFLSSEFWCSIDLGPSTPTQKKMTEECHNTIESDILALIHSENFLQAEELLIKNEYKVRLSSSILNYNYQDAVDENNREHEGFCTVLDNIFSDILLKSLFSVFCSGSIFWKQHNYDERMPVEYFSYAFPLDQGKGLMGQTSHFLIETLSEYLPELKETKYIEWWAHCRVHAAAHQLHFDSDNEGIGGVRNPIASCVIYLSEGSGGPTCVFDQDLHSTKLATKAWLCEPKKNRICMFRGDLLHGVIPGKPSVALPDTDQDPKRRVTLMIAFWKDLKIHAPEPQGAAMPHPGDEAEWAANLNSPVREEECFHKDVTAIHPKTIEPAWVPIGDFDMNHPRMPTYGECFQGA